MTSAASERRMRGPSRNADVRNPLLAAEEQLLLLTAGGRDNDQALRQVARDGVDWTRFLALAQLERAVPVVYPRLRSVAADIVPADTLDQMRRLALVSDFAMLHLEGRIRESTGALEAAGVRAMLLKGAALAYTAYSGIRQRPMSDVDILVDASNAQLAHRVMLATGWRDLVGGIPAHVYERHHHLPPLVDTRSPDLQLEIHTALFPLRQPFAFDAGSLWQRGRPLGATLPGAWVPDAAHALLHACLHFVWSHQARFGVWRTIRDVDALVRTGTIDWDMFVATARATRGATSCYWTFRLIGRAGGVAVPPSVLDQLRPPRSNYVLQAIEQHFMRNLFPVEAACPSVALDHALWELAVMPGWSGHGDVRPWDDEDEFVVPGEPGVTARPSHRERIRRLLASPAYIGALLRSRG